MSSPPWSYYFCVDYITEIQYLSFVFPTQAWFMSPVLGSFFDCEETCNRKFPKSLGSD